MCEITGNVTENICTLETADLGGGHGHNDKLHIDVVSEGEDVLVDAGRYQYTYHKKNRIWLKSAYAHNTLLVDNKDFMEYTDAWGSEYAAPELRISPIQKARVVWYWRGRIPVICKRGYRCF